MMTIKFFKIPFVVSKIPKLPLGFLGLLRSQKSTLGKQKLMLQQVIVLQFKFSTMGWGSRVKP